LKRAAAPSLEVAELALAAAVERDRGPHRVEDYSPGGFRLIARKQEAERTEYTYRAFFGRHPMKWRFVLDKEGRIADLEPNSRD
jgi:hypothetical protein